MPLSTSRKVWAILSPRARRDLVWLLGLMIVGMLLETVGVALVLPAVALLGNAESGGGLSRWAHLIGAVGITDRRRLIAIGVVALLAVYVVKNAFLGVLAWRQARFSHGLNLQLTQRLFALYLSQPYTFHLQRNSAYLVNSVVNEVAVLTMTGVTVGLVIAAEALMLLGITALLVAVEPMGTLTVAALLLVAGVVFYRVTRRRVRGWGEVRQYHDELSLQHLQQGLGAAKDIILLGRASEFLDQHWWHGSQRARAGQRHETLEQMPRLALEVLAVAGLAVLTLIMLGRGRPTDAILPTLGLFAAASFRAIPSTNRILRGLQQVESATSAVDLIHAEFTELTAAASPPRGERAPATEVVELIDVSYTYPGSARPALTGVTMRLARGDRVGIVGPSGGGKTTLVDLMLGLLTPTTGRVLVDGRPLADRLRAWQDQIGYVPQFVYLTDDTIRRNVAFGLPDAEIDDAAVWSALRAAQLGSFVESLPEGLESPLGERGTRMSGGQRQRVGIARALYHRPEVLVFDEATSALDVDTEREVMALMDGLGGTRTILVVSHRESTIERCQRVFRIEDGRVAEITTPPRSAR